MIIHLLGCRLFGPNLAFRDPVRASIFMYHIQLLMSMDRLTIIISWIMGKNLTLLFDPFESIVSEISAACKAT